MLKFRYKLLLAGIIASGLFLWGRCSNPKTAHPGHSPVVLPTNDEERIIVNPGNNTITIQTPSGTKTETLPDRPSTFDVLKNGTVKVSASQFGFEHHLFVSGLLSDGIHGGVGMDGMYFKRLDLGAGVGYPWTGFAKLTYNVKGNLQVGVEYQTNHYIGGIVSVRVF